jgi:ABC-type transporter Mla subunit MlaD
MPRLPGPGLPGVGDMLDLLRAQTEALAQLPATLAALNRSARRLAEATAQATETLLALQRLAIRLDRILDDVEEPVRALAPGMRRLAVVLDDPVVSTVPDSVRRFQETLPRLRSVLDLLEEAGSTLRNLPGAAFVAGLRRPSPWRDAAERETAEPAAPEPAPPPPKTPKKGTTSRRSGPRPGSA